MSIMWGFPLFSIIASFNSTFEKLNLQNSGKPRDTGKISGDQAFHYCEALLHFQNPTSFAFRFNVTKSDSFYQPTAFYDTPREEGLKSPDDPRARAHRFYARARVLALTRF